jgi:hypothetical protein
MAMSLTALPIALVMSDIALPDEAAEAEDLGGGFPGADMDADAPK